MHSTKKKRVRDVLIAVIFALTIFSQSKKFGSNSGKALTKVKCAASTKRLWDSWLYFLWSLCIRYLFYNNELILSLFHYKWINISSLCLVKGVIFRGSFSSFDFTTFLACNFCHICTFGCETELKTLFQIPFTECSTTTYLQSNSHKLKILLFLSNIEST